MSIHFELLRIEIFFVVQPIQSGELGLHHVQRRSVLADASAVASHNWLRGSYGLGHRSQGIKLGTSIDSAALE